MIGTIDDRELTALYEYWIGKCAGRAMPCRADIDPGEIPSLLPHIYLVDIHRPLRFRFRLLGTAICERWGENNTGKWLDEIDHAGRHHEILGQFSAVAQTGRPRFDTQEFLLEGRRYLHYRRLLLPLSEDGQTPTMLFGGQTAIGFDGYDVAAPKPSRVNWI